MSHASHEEEKVSHSETSSVASGRKSVSSKQSRGSKVMKLSKKYSEKYAIKEEESSEDEDQNMEYKQPKKVVHFGSA